MVKRYHIRIGDKTTADGTVIDGSTTEIAYDRGLAFEGDKVLCPTCKSVGQIVCDGPRLSWTGPDGRQAAISDDICLCKCNPHPRLIASQSTMWMEVDGSPGMGTSASSHSFRLPHDEQFLLRDSASGEPLTNVRYQIKTASGTLISGITDGSGRTQRVYTDAAEQLVFHLLHGKQA